MNNTTKPKVSFLIAAYNEEKFIIACIDSCLNQTYPVIEVCVTDNGLECDSNLGFADYAGFLCSTCYQYQVYDLENRHELNLHERPLIAMDTSVIDDNYMGLRPTEVAVDYLLELKRRCRYYNGDFVLLWHNQRFVDPREKDIYRTVIG